MRLKKWLGVRHIQLVMYSVLLFLDIYLTETVKLYIDNQPKIVRGGGRFHRITRSFDTTEFVLIKQALFLSFVFGRLIWPFCIMRMNNKYFIIVLTFVEIICCALFQQLVIVFEFVAFIVLVGLIYLMQSAHYPLVINIIAKWVPPNEYTRAVIVIAAGDTFARALVSTSAAWSNYAIMSVIFQVIVVLKIIWCIVYMVVGAQDPQTSFLVRKAEWELLSREIGPRKKVTCHMRIPWKSILTTPRLYAMIFSEIANKWFFLAVNSFRTYAPEINIDDAHIFMIFQPFVAYAVAWFVDHMIEKYYISRNNARKIMNTVALWGGALALAFMCYNYKNPGYVIFYLLLSTYFGLLVECSQTASLFDLSPNYATVIFSIYMIPAWASIIVRAQFYVNYSDGSSLEKTLPIFYRAGFLMFVLNYAFLMFGNITLLKFDSYDTYDWRKESIISYP